MTMPRKIQEVHMSEPYLPVPDPDPDGYRDPEPTRCPKCRSIVDVRGEVAWCPEHGWLSQEPENPEEEK